MRSPSPTDEAMAHQLPPTQRLAAHLASLRFAQLPESLVRLLQRCVLDAVAGKVTAGWGHQLEPALCDATEAGNAVVAAALAISEREGGVSGQRFLTALAAGMDLVVRLQAAQKNIGIEKASEAMALVRHLGAAVAAAQVLGLDAGGMARALDIAFTCFYSRESAGSQEAAWPGPRAGQAARAGVVAADLAAEDSREAREILAGPNGLFAPRDGWPGPDWKCLLDALGSAFPILSHHRFQATDDVVAARFLECAACSAQQISPESAAMFVRAVRHLDRMSDMRQLGHRLR